MLENPYQAPGHRFDEFSRPPTLGRPLGISILAVLHGVGALLMGALFAFFAMSLATGAAGGFLAWLMVILAPLFAGLSLATAAGLWKGKKWAWWLATIYYYQFALGGVVVLVTIVVAITAMDRPVTSRSVDLTIKHLVRLVLFSLLTAYMTSSRVFAFFRFATLTRFRAIAISSGVVLALALLLAPVFFFALLPLMQR